MELEQNIKKRICEKLKVDQIEIINNSHLHQHHASSPKTKYSHLKIIVKSKEWYQQPRIKLHQMIYSILEQELKNVIHALEIEVIE